MSVASRQRATRWRVGGAVGAVAAAATGVALLAGTDPAGVASIYPASVDLGALDAVPAERWDALRQKRILFGHQSVGNDILAGLEEIAIRKPHVRLRVIESRDPASFDEPGLVHFKVGANEQAGSKLADFEDVLGGPLGKRADLAFMKFCYVDLFRDGDPAALHGAYQQTVSRVQRANRSVRLLHLTMPLTTVETGRKARLKVLLGRDNLGGYAHNRVRHEFNESLRRLFAKEGTLFDLARSQSTLPGGARAEFTSHGVRCECLTTGYTHDGGHLNEAGRLAVARDFLLFLAEQCR